MLKILRLHTCSEKSDDFNLTRLLLNIRKYRLQKHVERLKKSVKEMRQKFSIWGAAKKLNMNYSELHHIITQCKHSGRNVSELNKKNALEFYASHRITLSLPFKKYAKNMYLRSTLGVAYEEYVRKQHALGNRVLSQSAVYRCIKGKVRMRRRVPFKDCQCDECLNHGLLIDALIVAGVKGISRRNTHNVLKSFCPMMGKECDTDKRTKGTGRQLFKEQNVVITDHKCDCIFRNCKLCGSVRFQKSIQLWNEGMDWNKTVTWHQWEYVHKDDTKLKKNEKKYFDKVRYTGSVAQLLALFMRSLHNYSDSFIPLSMASHAV